MEILKENEGNLSPSPRPNPKAIQNAKDVRTYGTFVRLTIC